MIVNTLHIRVGGGGGGNGGGGNGGGGNGGDISVEQKSINGHQSFFTLWDIQNIIHSLKYVDKAIQRSS
jgi:hypothetical protein